MEWINEKQNVKFKGLETITIEHLGLSINIPKGYWFAVSQTGIARAFEEKPDWAITFGMIGYWEPLYDGIELGKVDLSGIAFTDTLIQA